MTFLHLGMKACNSKEHMMIAKGNHYGWKGEKFQSQATLLFLVLFFLQCELVTSCQGGNVNENSPSLVSLSFSPSLFFKSIGSDMSNELKKETSGKTLFF